MLTSLVAALGRLARRIANFRWRSRRLTVDIERKTALFEVDVAKQTSLDLRIDYGKRCEEE
tara:strand:- start:986 stop:1168 length:183 start_codon:yes stop_codon:yes gene_type:complete